jgi:nicotinate-nucleotide pyrophosphorylase (carboxylating)
MIPQSLIDQVVKIALAEDAPWGDLTSQNFIPETATSTAHLVAREPGVFCGAKVFETVITTIDAKTSTIFPVEDGASFNAGEILATVSGSARSVLQAERVALNFVQRMSGIATLTAKYVAEIADTRARIVDTRKTTPGLRALERYAVRCGGGSNHRFSLSDAVMVKDNHLAVLTASSKLGVTAALREARAKLPHTVHFEVEVDRIDQIEPVLAAGVDTIMLDNFTLEELRQGVALVAGRALIEASGNVNLATVGDIARTGVDIISIGALTHSVRALDLGLDIEIDAASPALSLQ